MSPGGGGGELKIQKVRKEEKKSKRRSKGYGEHKMSIRGPGTDAVAVSRCGLLSI
jgi:hypothetical protein